mmetsp:Transcript_79/g.152  ORF Transcript_79/g.152 Transcript_79/m.152 type:complete len:122 (+) Transcript_79:548-913(+)
MNPHHLRLNQRALHNPANGSNSNYSYMSLRNKSVPPEQRSEQRQEMSIHRGRMFSNDLEHLQLGSQGSPHSSPNYNGLRRKSPVRSGEAISPNRSPNSSLRIKEQSVRSSPNRRTQIDFHP